MMPTIFLAYVLYGMIVIAGEARFSTTKYECMSVSKCHILPRERAKTVKRKFSELRTDKVTSYIC